MILLNDRSKMKKEPQTAENLLKIIIDCLKIEWEDMENDPELIPYLIDEINNRTKLHVKAALKAASESSDDITTKQCVEDILNSYPEENIK